MHTTYTNPRISNLKLKSRSSPSSPGNPKSHRNARQIQNQLDSLRARKRSSLSRNSTLMSDISRLKQQVTHMNVSFSKLERARDSYDRYVQDCMVTWIQKEFRESETNNPVSSRYKPESEHAASAVHVTPTKTIGIQTTEEHLSVQVSDWSISPETQSQLIPHLHSTMMVPNVSSKPPRDTSQRQTALPSQTQTETSLLPPMINFSDLRTPNVPPDATFFSYDQSNFSANPSAVSALPESPVPPGLPSHLPRRPIPSNSTPTLTSAVNFNSTFHSISNVSMKPFQEGDVYSQRSYELPRKFEESFCSEKGSMLQTSRDPFELDVKIGSIVDSQDYNYSYDYATVSDNDVEISAGYVPDFGANQSMSDREKKNKFEKFWGSDLDSESEGERVKPAKKKSSMDDFDFD